MAAAAVADPLPRAPSPFAVVLNDCTEFAGLGPLAGTQIQGRLPPGYTAATFGPGTAGVVARASRCDRVSVDGGPVERATVSHIGINLMTPDGTGDINNYTLLYVTDSWRLAAKLREFGLPVRIDSNMVYEVNPAGSALELYAQVQAEPGITYFLDGVVNDPAPGTAAPFLANWWYSSRAGRMKMSTDIPAFAAGQADVALFNSRESALGQFLAGNRTVFPLLSVRGKFSHAVMTVSLER
ncbi:MAG: hypothetical protein ABI330_16730 [Caldimonas sp.]|nr:hypothetical protein [Pseudomonadota bacterium]